MKYLLAALLFLAPIEASANTVLFAGDELSSFSTVGLVGSNNAAGYFRSNFTRGYLNSYNSGVSDPPGNRAIATFNSAVSDVWVQFHMCDGTSCQTGTSSGEQLLRVMDSAGNPTIVVRGTGTANQLQINSRTSGAVFTTLATCSLAFTGGIGGDMLTLHVVYASSGGSVTWYDNGNQICTFSGNTTNGDGATTLTSAEFSGPLSGSNPSAFSEVLITDFDARGYGVFDLYDNANGASTSWAGTNVCTSIWNAFVYNDTTYAQATSSGLVHNCGVYHTLPALYEPYAVVMSTRALAGASAPTKLDFDTSVAGTDYLSSAYTPTTSFNPICCYVQTINPATGVAWTTSDITSGTFYLGLKSQP